MKDANGREIVSPLDMTREQIDGIEWLAGWYATKLHAVTSASVTIPRNEIRSKCGAWVSREPRTEWAAKNIRRGVGRCKHCERILRQNKEISIPVQRGELNGVPT